MVEVGEATPKVTVSSPIKQVLAEEAQPFDEEQHEEEPEEGLIQHIHAEKGLLFACILLTLFIAVISSVMAESGLFYAIVGFLPTILTLLVFIWLLEQNFKDILFWMTPLAVNFAFLLLGPFINQLFSNQLDILVLTGINMILSYLFLAMMTLVEYARQPRDSVDLEGEFEAEKLPAYIHTIEDKCKAINFAIGRVYRNSRGGSKTLREKIKVPSDWYNEFNSIAAKEINEQKDAALHLVTKIQERLSFLLKPEKDLFTANETKALKNLARDAEGRDRILDVLTVNDQDPVEDFFLGAMDFCKKISAGVGEIIKCFTSSACRRRVRSQ